MKKILVALAIITAAVFGAGGTALASSDQADTMWIKGTWMDGAGADGFRLIYANGPTLDCVSYRPGRTQCIAR